MIKITFTGDVMCEHTRLAHFYNNGNYDFTPIFEDVIQIFEQSDYVVANLETPLAGSAYGYSEKRYSFNTPDEMADALTKCGVRLVTTANNHVLDRGISGLERTLDVLDSKGIQHTGSYRFQDNSQPFITSIGGIRVAFLSYTYGTEACFNGYYLKKSQFYMVNMTRNQELSNPIKRFFLVNNSIPAKVFRLLYRITLPKQARLDVSERKEKDAYQIKHLLSDIDYCKNANVDYIIMCLHCGGQLNDAPTDYTKKMVNICLSNGVNAVITNHEHRIQGSKLSNDGIVTFCLGNFTSDYGIARGEIGSHIEYSALFHLYLDKKDVLNTKCAVTFLKSHMNENGQIVTTPVSQLFRDCDDEIEREALMKDNLWCLNTFFGLSLTEAPMQDEYDAQEYVARDNIQKAFI